MERGQYNQYLRNIEVPVPDSTLRRRLRNENEEAGEQELAEAVEPEDAVADAVLDHFEGDFQLQGNNDAVQNDQRQDSSGESDHDNESEDDWESAEGSANEREDSAGEESGSDSDVSEIEEHDQEFDEYEEYEDVEHEEEQPPAEDRVPLYEGCHISLEESRLLILSFSLRFGLSDKAIDHLLKLVNCHLPDDRHGSFHMFKKSIPTPPLVHTEYYCAAENCARLLVFADDQNIVVCECGQECNKDILYKLGCYFLRLPLQEQLVSLFQDDTLRNKLRWEDDSMSDVISGKVYTKCLNRGIILPHRDLTVQFNTDGVKVHKSSSIQLWPIQACINELPFKERKENMILCGLWYGEGKPNMNTFLQPFVQELNSLHLNGFQFPSNPPIVAHVHTILSSVDSMARPPMQNMKTFRGISGCSFCLHPGEEIVVGRGPTRLYLGDLGPLRTDEQHRRDVNDIVRRRRIPRNFAINGIKGPSILLGLRGFHIIHSFVPDYLHCVLLGCVKTMVDFWTMKSNNGKNFYIGSDTKIAEFDSFLLTIKPPQEITRTPRSLSRRKLWRGHEWKNFLLYYSIPCLRAINFPNRYLNHWFLLVFGISCFLRDKITHELYVKGTEALRRYVLTMEEVYETPVLMKFNTHLLLHIPKSVKDFGALFASSTFAYEHFNGVLAKMFRSSQAVPLQICKNYVRMQGLREELNLRAQDNRLPLCMRQLLTSLACGKTTQHTYRFGDNLILLGAPGFGVLPLVHQNLIENLVRENIHNSQNDVRFYKRFIYKNVMHHVENYEPMTKRINCTILTTDGQYLSLTHVIRAVTVVTNRSVCILLGFKLYPTDDMLCMNRELNIFSDSFSVVLEKTNEYVAIHPQSVSRKCLVTFYPRDHRKMCCFPLVNLVERD